MIVAIDPGPVQSAWIICECGQGRIQKILGFGYDDNSEVYPAVMAIAPKARLCVEMVASYGMAVGADIFETCVQIGMFIEQWRTWGDSNINPRCFRKDIKLHICGQMRAKDANVSQALRDKYGGKGTKANPGMLFGISKHIWAALAVADYAASFSR